MRWTCLSRTCLIQVINEQVDVWALGVLLYVMAYNRFPFDPSAPLAILNGRYAAPPGGQARGWADGEEQDRLLEALEGCLVVDPETRKRASEVLALVQRREDNRRLGAASRRAGVVEGSGGGEGGEGERGGEEEGGDLRGWARFDG